MSRDVEHFVNAVHSLPVLEPLDDYAPSPIEVRWASNIGEGGAELDEIVEDTFTAGGMSIVHGPPNAGKTTLLLDLAMRMPSGLPWLGKRVRQGAVLWIALEAPGSVYRRVNAYRKHHGCKLFAFGVIGTQLSLLDGSRDLEDLIDKITEVREIELLDSEPLRLVVVDTVADAMAGADENAFADMSRLTRASARIQAATGAHVAWIHHTGKDEDRGARGHSSLTGKADTVLKVSGADGMHTVEVTKQRDLGTRGMKLSARFVPVELGANQWGKPITACVVEPVEQPSAHLQSIIDANAREAAESAVVNGLRKLQSLGLVGTPAKNSPDFLPRKLHEMNLAAGFDRKELEAATNDMIVRGVLTIAPLGRFKNGDPRKVITFPVEA